MVDMITGHVSSEQTERSLVNIAQRVPDELEVLERNNDNLSHKIRVATPCQVVSFDAAKQTIVAQPLIREKIIDRATGSISWQQLPQLLDVPVQFPQAGNFVMTFPPEPGDECLVIFADSCIDAWWFSGGVQNWMDRRRHDLSDGIAILGISSVPNVIQDIATDAAELRTKDGAIKVSVKQTDAGVNSLTLTSDGSIVQMEKQALVSNGIPAQWDNIKLASGEADAASVTIGMTNTTEIIGGVPVDVPTPTVSLVGKILNNGTPL